MESILSEQRENVEWKYPALKGVRPTGMGIAAHNYEAMKGEDMDYLDMLLWVDAVAKSFNRYIDSHKIAEDQNAKECLKWWANHLFFVPSKL